MFRSKTLFILGAGASNEVGLPIGDELKDQIAHKINIKFPDGYRQESGDHQIMWAFRQLANQRMDQNPNVFLETSWQLIDALPQAISIDNLLDAHRDHPNAAICGKLGIVKSIQEAERRSSLYLERDSREKLDFSKVNKTWFAGFTKILTEGVAKSEVNSIFENVGFVSFNYDRCIEHYVFNALKSYYGIQNEEAREALKKMEIHHPYGQLGRLPWQQTSLPIHDFGSEDMNLLEVFKQIKTFNERIQEDHELQKIKKLFSEAEMIVFLGFAFHKQNMEILNPSSNCKAKRIFATAFGVSNSDCDVIRDEIKNVLKSKGRAPKIEIRNDLKCADLFREYWRSLTS
jgi:hypothetical protein